VLVPAHQQNRPGICPAALKFWNDRRMEAGFLPATVSLLAALWEFARDSTPQRLRSRFGDADYDWDHRVNTTSGAVGWQDRLLGEFHSAYQPTDPAFFSEMMDALQRQTNSNLQEFTFVDLGSGKGRVLLMASEYPFRGIIGIELLPSLNRIAEENIALYRSETQKCSALHSICGDATSLSLPEGPIVLYLFNPFPEPGLKRTLANLKMRLEANPSAIYLLYHNPVLEHILGSQPFLKKIIGGDQYSLYAASLRP
jgi:Histone methylation protein DOT1